jgi:RHS repeat-associated protein
LLTKRDLATSEITTYDYDEFGALRSVQLPGGQLVQYEIDAAGRRVGKRLDGVKQWGLLYSDGIRPVAQLDAGDNVVSTFVYATRGNVPDYMIKAGATFRIVVDHLGSVRVVINVADGAIAQRLDYDEFGNVLADSNPGFQPFGFAGGLYDTDTALVRFGARDYSAEIGRWTAKDPILFRGGQSNLYVYANDDSVNGLDINGYYELCTAPLHALGAWGQGAYQAGYPLLYHEYLCVTIDGVTTCGGQDRSGGPWSPGKPSSDTRGGGMCKSGGDDRCVDQCIYEAFGKARPQYGLIGPGTNCQEWAEETVERCKSACGSMR